jgi:Cellulase (glycosyl hydrolase family 5)
LTGRSFIAGATGTLLLCLALATPGSSVSTAPRPLETGFVEASAFTGPDASLAFKRVRAAGATIVRLNLGWPSIAPTGVRKPAGFVPTNAGDPLYHWTAFDREVKLAAARGLKVIAQITGAPEWAEGVRNGSQAPAGTFRPSPQELARFATAAARRYGGSFEGLPRVRIWQVWDEPNATTYLTPQLSGRTVVSAAWYRSMVNAFADAVHAVHRDNAVIAGGLSPFTQEAVGLTAVGPLRFMRAMLCLSAGARPRSTCGARVRFDIWSTHPFTSGGPTHHAANPDDVSIGDLPRMRQVLDAAIRLHKVSSRQAVRFWVTEFGWDTNPPDPDHTVPIKLHARWVAEALYRMWQAGVSAVVWLQLRDGPYPKEATQSGLWFRGGARLASDRPKPGLAAFRFPFVAFRAGASLSVWGRTPTGRPADVIVERGGSGHWRRIGVVRADRYGIFARTLPGDGKGGFVRARLAKGGFSPGFSLTPVPDRFVLPFGGGGS